MIKLKMTCPICKKINTDGIDEDINYCTKCGANFGFADLEYYCYRYLKIAAVIASTLIIILLTLWCIKSGCFILKEYFNWFY